MRKRPITLLEFLVILAIVGVLILLCIPMTTKIDDVGPRHLSQSNLHHMGIACHDYHSNFRSLPPGMTLNQQGKMLHGWQTYLLPFLEESNLYRRLNLESPWDDPVNAPAMREQVRVYLSQLLAEEQD